MVSRDASTKRALSKDVAPLRAVAILIIRHLHSNHGKRSRNSWCKREREFLIIISSYLHHISGDTLEGRIHGFAIDENLTFQAPRIDSACQSIQKRRLRWARRSCNCQQLALMDVHRYIVQKRLLHCLSLHSRNHLQFKKAPNYDHKITWRV